MRTLHSVFVGLFTGLGDMIDLLLLFMGCQAHSAPAPLYPSAILMVASARAPEWRGIARPKGPAYEERVAQARAGFCC